MDEATRPRRVGSGSVEDPVLAAGVLLWTGSREAPRFLLLKNARHGTWGFPKGHAEPGEELSATALREAEEETGYRLQPEALLAGYADTHAYRPDDSYWKRVVHYLAAAPVDEAALVPSDEHDQVAWLEAEAALERLDFPDLQRAVVRAAAALART